MATISWSGEKYALHAIKLLSTRYWLRELSLIRVNFWNSNWQSLRAYFQKYNFQTLREKQCWLIAELESNLKWELYKNLPLHNLLKYLRSLPCWPYFQWSEREEHLFSKLLHDPRSLLLANEIGEGVFIDNYSLVVQYFCMRAGLTATHLAFDFLLSPHWIRFHAPSLATREQLDKSAHNQFSLLISEEIDDQKSPSYDPMPEEIVDLTAELDSSSPSSSPLSAQQPLLSPSAAAQASKSISNAQPSYSNIARSQNVDVNFLDLLGPAEKAVDRIFFIQIESFDHAHGTAVVCRLELLDHYLSPRIKVTSILSQMEFFVPALQRFWACLIKRVNSDESLLIPFYYGLLNLKQTYLPTVVFLENSARFLKERRDSWSQHQDLCPYFDSLLSGQWLNEIKPSFHSLTMPQLTEYCDQVLFRLRKLQKLNQPVQPSSNSIPEKSLLSMSLSHDFEGF